MIAWVCFDEITKTIQEGSLFNIKVNLSIPLDSLVVECPGIEYGRSQVQSSQGPRHTKDVIKVVPVVTLFDTEHTGSFSRIKIKSGIEKSFEVGRHWPLWRG